MNAYKQSDLTSRRNNIKLEDKVVGANVRRLRESRNMSQEKLGNALKITFQQIQKYEKGTNRISCSKLVLIARALKYPIAFFFDGIEVETNETTMNPHHEFCSITGANNFIAAVNNLHDDDKHQVIKACIAIVQILCGAKTRPTSNGMDIPAAIAAPATAQEGRP